MDSSGDLMPLPDADKKSPRVYTNLQNIDLDTVTFANVQDTGNPIAVEEMNEDEMRRLVLVNLARLVTAGEWTGLLEAGGGGNEYNVVLPEDFGATGYVRYVINSYPPWGSGQTSTEAFSVSNNNDKVFMWPFIAPESGVVAEMGIEITSASSSANNINVGIYSSVAVTGAPDTLLGTGVFDSQSVAVVYDTTLSATVTLVKGTQYWIGLVRSTAEIACTFKCIQQTYATAISPVDQPNVNGNSRMMRLSNSDLTLPTSPTLTDLYPNSKNQPCVSLKIT